MRFLLLTFLTAISISSIAQRNVSGSWFGVADALLEGSHNNYMVELTIRQKGNDVEGVFGYYFRDGYQSYFVRGTFNQKTNTISIKNLPITYFRGRNVDGVDCYMDFAAVLTASRVKTSMKGAFTPHDRYKYTCPSLRISYELDTTQKNTNVNPQDKATAIKKYWQPRTEDLVMTTNTATVPATVPATQNNEDTVIQGIPTPIKKALFTQLVKNFEQRKNVLQKEIEIESDSIRVSFYDNGDIDGDSIAVFMNKVPVLTHQLLSAQSLNMYLSFSNEKPTTDISMFAENLGTIPPNTALMIVTDGEKKHEVYMSSSLTQNATVRLKRKKK